MVAVNLKMCSRRSAVSVAAMAVVLSGNLPVASATVKYWDADKATSGLQGGTNAVWDTASATNWNTSSNPAANSSSATNWSDGDDANFIVASSYTVDVSGTVTANSITGSYATLGTGVGNGTIAVGAGGITSTGGGASPLTINSNVLLNGGQTWTTKFGSTILNVAGKISDGGSAAGLTFVGVAGTAGTITLAGANDYSGGTTLTLGLVQAANNSAFGTGKITLNGGGLGTSGSTAITLANHIEAASTTVDVKKGIQLNATDLTLTGSFVGVGAISTSNQSSNTHALNLLGNNSAYAGSFVGNGAITLTFKSANAGSASAAWTFNNGSEKLDFGGGTLALGAINTTQSYTAFTTVAPASGSTPYLLQLGNSSGLDGAFAAQINQVTNAPLSLTKTGTNKQTLSNASSNYGGGTTINGGILAVSKLSNTGSASSVGSGSLTLDGGTLQYIGTGDSTNRVLTLGANGGTLDNAGTGALSYTPSPTVAFSGTGTRTLTLAATSTLTNTFGGVLNDSSSGTTSLKKTGAGTWALSGTSGYTGATQVNEGTLQVNGTLGNTPTTVAAGATLAGTGVVGGALAVGSGGHVAPGAAVATASLAVGGATMTAGAAFDVDLSGTSFTLNGTEQYDRLLTTGTVALGGATLNLTTLPSSLAGTDVYGILQNGSGTAISGTFAGLGEGATVATIGDYALKITYAGNVTDTSVATAGGNDVVLYATAVPEPTAAALLALALPFLARRRTVFRG